MKSIWELEDLVESQHRAIDWLLANLLLRDKDFLPSKSEIWPTVVRGGEVSKELAARQEADRRIAMRDGAQQAVTAMQQLLDEMKADLAVADNDPLTQGGDDGTSAERDSRVGR